MKVFLVVIVVGLLIVVVDLLVGIAHIVTAPDGGSSGIVAAHRELLAPLIEPRLPASAHRALEARAIAAAGITCMQAATEEWVRLRGRADIAELYDIAVRAARRP
ncbi:hypothetical protein [Nocardioides astragali]|uniref:Uncharacterized protein n=1 Tax=Nocardioides astragali TaxID=1776736 RepID=A0ABW2N7J1_9ACTN|nr:hypothetical protein [Nocardioides astragali]